MIAVPCAFMRASTANSRSISRFSSAAVGSSRMKTRQRRRSALAIATSWRSAKPSERDARGRDRARNRAATSTAACVATHARAIDHRERAEPSHRKIAERDVLGHRQGRHQAQLLRDGHDAGGDRIARARKVALLRRRRGSSPRSGRCTPPRMRISVDLPAPFSPTMAWISPSIDVEVDAVERHRGAELLADALRARRRMAHRINAGRKRPASSRR